MAILIDGYNLLFTIGLPRGADGPRKLEAARFSLLDFLVLQLLPSEVAATTVVFDAKQSCRAENSHFDHRGITVRFAHEQEEADDLLEILIAADPHPDRLLVVSSDRRVQTAAVRRSAQVVESEAWLEHLQGRGVVSAAEDLGSENQDDQRQHQPSPDEIQHWLDEFCGMEPDGVDRAKGGHGVDGAGDREGRRDSTSRSLGGKNLTSADEDSDPPAAEPVDRSDPAWNPFPPGYGEDLG
ncbi:MAG: NYN domain-containing protein [Pirellulaceae bacterium]|nr:NYN domain-containing protein [Pirellulaceae bacterium]